MHIYSILENGHKIGVARGKEASFAFIQKEIDRQDVKGYWSGEKYIGQDNINYSFERADDE